MAFYVVLELPTAPYEKSLRVYEEIQSFAPIIQFLDLFIYNIITLAPDPPTNFTPT